MDQAIPREPSRRRPSSRCRRRAKLVKSLRRLDMVGFTVCAFVGLDTLGTVASNGAQGFTWLIVLALVFVLPYALLMAEVGSAFTQEGGPYEWSKMAFGRLQGAIAAVLYWVTNPLWVGGSLAFIATEAWNDNIFKIHSGAAGDYVFKFLFIWLSIGVAIVSLKRGKWIPNVGAFMRIVVLGLFTHHDDHLRLLARRGRLPGQRPQADRRDLPRPRPAAALQLRRLRAAERRRRGDERPAEGRAAVASCAAAIIGVLLYAIPSSRSSSCCPPEKVTGIGGFLDAVTETFTVYGGASELPARRR